MYKSLFLLLVTFFLQLSCSKIYIEGKDGLVISLNVSDGTRSDGVMLDWEKNWEFFSFVVLRSVNPNDLHYNNESFIIVKGIIQNSFLDKKSFSEREYYYKVLAYNKNNRLLGSSEIIKGTRSLPVVMSKSPPSDLMATQGEYSDKIILYWTYKTSGALFRIYRKQDADFVLIAETDDRTYIDTDIQGNGSYEYKVSTIGIESGSVQEYPTSPVNGFILSSPQNLNASLYSRNPSGSIELVWNENSSIDFYEIYRSKKTDSGYELIMPSISGTRFVDLSLPDITGSGTGEDFKYPKYYYKIRAIKNGQKGPFTDDVVGEAINPADELDPPSSLAIAKPGWFGTRWTISWQPVSGASGYRIYRKADGAEGWFDVTDIAKSPFSDPCSGAFLKSVPKGTQVIYQVQALDATKAGLPLGKLATVSAYK